MAVSGYCWRDGCGHHVDRHELVDVEFTDVSLQGQPAEEGTAFVRWGMKCSGMMFLPTGPALCKCHSFVMKEVPSGKTKQEGSAG